MFLSFITLSLNGLDSILLLKLWTSESRKRELNSQKTGPPSRDFLRVQGVHNISSLSKYVEKGGEATGINTQREFMTR